jgi:serine/threonine-protein kinase
MPEIIGQMIYIRYRVDTFIGRGGMAEVFKVWDNLHSVPLGMKVLPEDLVEDITFLRRFKREAQTLARIQHPNVMSFYALDFSINRYIFSWNSQIN